MKGVKWAKSIHFRHYTFHAPLENLTFRVNAKANVKYLPKALYWCKRESVCPQQDESVEEEEPTSLLLLLSFFFCCSSN
ncbi:hypothetical protein VNO80_27045 [Phaseolus coccineus]|uniref:Uncharacterized protein n=1 Tax=Phaseolus coccineus TaxID=3886 RepID=A0AAN9QL11_PHACN